jgi:hypothetical protein
LSWSPVRGAASPRPPLMPPAPSLKILLGGGRGVS